jgi:predicted CopG family antitoxin
MFMAEKWACNKTGLMQFSCMPFTTITISTEAHARLRKLKEPGDSFSDVILRTIPRPCATAGEMLDAFKNVELPAMNKRRMALLRSGRGRRSHRPGQIAK